MKLRLVLCIVGWTAAFAAPIPFDSVTFDGFQPGEQVLSYYDGGLGGQLSGPCPLRGVSFTQGLAADSATIAFGPSARLTAQTVTMNLDDPWSGMISFYFAGAGVVSFYPGLNAGGTLLRSFSLTSPFSPFGAVPGRFQSAVFESDTSLQLDSITFGAQVIPEPNSLALLWLGTLSVAGFRRFTAEPERRGTSFMERETPGAVAG